jgi:hypothetical protein
MLISYIEFISGKAEKQRKNISYLFLLFQKGRKGRFNEKGTIKGKKWKKKTKTKKKQKKCFWCVS